MVQILRDKERLALFRDGKYIGLKGPGIVVYLPFLTTTLRLQVGDRGNLMTQELAQFGDMTIPVTGGSLSGSHVRIVGFDDSQPVPRPRVETVDK